MPSSLDSHVLLTCNFPTLVIGIDCTNNPSNGMCILEVDLSVVRKMEKTDVSNCVNTSHEASSSR